MTPRQRVVAYVRRYRARYAVGALLTVGYSIAFQMVPLAVRDVVGEISSAAGQAAVEVSGPDLPGVPARTEVYANLSSLTALSLGR